MFNDIPTEQLLNICGHAYDAACLRYAKKSPDYPVALKELLDIVDELIRRNLHGV